MQINSNKNYKITDRILQILDYKGISKYKFHKDLGLSNGFLDKSREIGTDKYAKILEYFKDVNPEWLLIGRGSMFKDADEKEEKIPAKISRVGTPLVGIEAIAGFGNNSFAISENDILGRYVVPDFAHLDFMIRVAGDSMVPRYSPGDIVGCRIIKESSFIQWGRVYVLATVEQGILIKRIDVSDKDNCIKAVSDNPAYKSFDIPRKEITGMAIVVGVIRLE